MSTITINEKIYQIADLTEAARQQIANIQFVDAEQSMSLALAAFVYQKIVGEIQ